LSLPPLNEVEERLKKKIHELAEEKRKTIMKIHEENIKFLRTKLRDIAEKFAKKLSI
jgi:polyhydroxyalkanoate synthesis regulator phasin